MDSIKEVGRLIAYENQFVIFLQSNKTIIVTAIELYRRIRFDHHL